jgi:hypothetical protein|tara:strand:- start:130 stop:672 length:543 start_codon:yes stop_codon:yes gene_type:complete
MDLWTQQFGLVDDCLRACVFGEYIWSQNPPEDSAWPALSDICYSDAIISWNQLFGQRSQETHWTKLVKNIEIPDGDKLKPFNKEMIITYLGIIEKEWEAFHKLMVDSRNTRVAHLNVGFSIYTLPNITKAMHTAYLYRDWLTEALHLGNRLGYNINVSQDRAKDAVEKYRELIANAYSGL